MTNITVELTEDTFAVDFAEKELIDVTLGEVVQIINKDSTTDYNELENLPTLGTASAEDIEFFATAEQGAKADTAIQTETDPTVPSWAKESTKPSYTKSEVGLGNVDNTSDLNKPISTATKSALDDKASLTQSNVFNPSGAAVTQQFAGDNINYLLHVDGSNDRVGIGTGSPASILDVVDSTAGYANLRVGSYSALARDYSAASLILGSNVWAKQSAAQGMEIINTHGSFGGRAIRMHSTQGMTFHTMSGSVTAGDDFASERMRIHNNGNVTIGSTGSYSKLHITGDTTNNPTDGLDNPFFSLGNSTNVYGLKAGVLGNGNTWLQGIRFDNSIYYHLLLNPLGGRVGISTSSPGNYALDVGGNTNVQGNVTSSGGGANGSGVQTLISAAYVQSRGENLVTNGSGNLGNKYNFSQFVYDPVNVYLGKGSFSRTGVLNPGYSDESMPVDTGLTYELSLYAKEITGTPNTRFYAGLACVDVDNLSIQAYNTMFQPGTTTTLTQELKNGDTEIHVASLANWSDNTGTTNHLRNIIVWGYKNSAGYTYPDETYSRIVRQSAYNNGGLDYDNNIITLATPWNLGTIPNGTSISNGSSGGSYKYIAASNRTLTSDWVKYAGRISGTDYSGQNNPGFFPGTANVRLLFLMNYSTGDQTGTQNISALSFGVVPQQPRVKVVPTGTFFPSTDEADVYLMEGLIGSKSISNPTGTPKDGDRFIFRFSDNGTARALTWGSQFRNFGAQAPTTTIVGKTIIVETAWNSASSTWDVLEVYTQDDFTVRTSQLATKADFPSTNEHVPYRNSSGTQTSLPVSAGLSANSIVLRSANNQFSAASPTADAHVATKKYVDDKVTGASGTFTSQDGKTVTVAGGLITDIT